METTITTLGTGSLYMLVILLLLTSLQGSPVGATDVITATRPLSWQQKLVSQGDKFALGFYQPGGGPQDKWYISIWCNKVQKPTPVWIANREAPISDPASSVLTIWTDGNLVLLNKSRSIVWSSNISTTTGSSNTTIVALLLNTGNLVLAYASNTSNIIWQSFNHPTDTQLPGMKFGRNKITGVSDRLVSWRDHTDPSPGIFSAVMDPRVAAQYLLIWNNSHPYYTPGKFNPQTGAFAGIPSMTVMSRPNSVYTYEYVDNDEEEYFLLTVKDDNILLRTVIDPSGQQKGMFWIEEKQDWTIYFLEPNDMCSIYSACGAFSWCAMDNNPIICSCLKGFSVRSPTEWRSRNYIGGCTRNVALSCSLNGGGSTMPSMSSRHEEDRFYIIDNVKLPDGSSQTVQAASISMCEAACLSNCSCLAYSYSGICSLWYSDLMNLQKDPDNIGNSIFIRLPASEIPRTKSTRGRTIGVAIGVSALALGVCLMAVLCLLRRRRINGVRNIDMNLMAFRYKDLQLITKNFSDKLGTGSFGSVFKGVLQDGTVVAIKKLEGVRQGEKQFRAEMSTIGKIHHVNLIRLLGFCSEGEHRLLVYEYMPHGSLDGCLFKAKADDVLPWNTRYQIAIGVAKGLTYLHDKCRDCIIHCDIKPQNILLDTSFAPKVSDFGLAKLLGRDFSRVMTTMRGTIGYLAPEWISGAAITMKADVFSYGMMLFEIVSHKRNIEHGGKRRADKFFPIQVAEKIQEGNVLALFAADLRRDVNLEELERACMVACWCVQEDESFRPTMGAVVQMLEGLLQVTTPPVPRYLQVLAEAADQSSTLLDKLAVV